MLSLAVQAISRPNMSRTWVNGACDWVSTRILALFRRPDEDVRDGVDVWDEAFVRKGRALRWVIEGLIVSG